jgi:hypothetical protein
MGLQQQLARVAAVIVLIAAFALPSLAIAHEGHAHHPSQVAPTSSESTSADVRGHEQPAVRQIATLSATHSPIAPGVVVPCGGNCCGGGAGMACCGAALAPEAFWILLPQSSAQLAIPRAPPLPDLPPEALPKPPKTIV